MKKKDVYRYFDSEEYPDDESSYDFSAVNLRGDKNTDGFYDDLDAFSFDDDSYGDLPFAADEELVEEDFALGSIVDEDDDGENYASGDTTGDIDDESFLLDYPEEVNVEYFDDEDDLDDVEQSSPSNEENYNIKSNTFLNIQNDATLPVKGSVSKTDKIMVATAAMRSRNSALQPLLVINRSKHSFDSAKKKFNIEGAETAKVIDDFDDFAEENFPAFDDDIEDISRNLFFDSVSENDKNEISKVAEEIVEEFISESDDTDEETSDVVEAIAEVTDEETDENNCEKTVEDFADDLVSETDDKTSEEDTAGNNDGDESDDIISTAHSPLFQNDLSALDSDTISSDFDVPEKNADDISLEKDETVSAVKAEPEATKAPDESVSIDSPEENTDSALDSKRLARKKRRRKKKVKNLTKEIISWTALVLAAFLIAIVVNLYVARPSVVSGRSMMPTLENGDTIVISKLPYMLGDIEYGDIVVIDRQTKRDRTFTVEVVESLKYNVLTQSLFDENDLTEDTFWVKRIIGKPGDVIEFSGGKVYRNGELLNEPYIYTQMVTTYPEGQQFVVREGCIFVMGDNRNESLDSRALAMQGEQIAVDHIVGKLISK